MEITKLHEACLASPAIRTATRGGQYMYAMHSALSTAEQNAAFDRPPEGGYELGASHLIVHCK